MISPTASPPRHRAPAVKRFKLVDLSGDLQPSVHRPLRTDGTPISKGIKALQSMLNLPEAAARAVRLFDSKEAEVQVHAADTLGNPGLVSALAPAGARARRRAPALCTVALCAHAAAGSVYLCVCMGQRAP